jgi:hypothetical protein
MMCRLRKGSVLIAQPERFMPTDLRSLLHLATVVGSPPLPDNLDRTLSDPVLTPDVRRLDGPATGGHDA